ncbi:MAG: hypothetical protein JNK25_11025 [Phycisphaerae bacterium]|nr:hypothetical protein [Phycisphaerae bacterium]
MMQWLRQSGSANRPRAIRAAGVMRSVSGAPAAWRARRGSFLVLVVGTLALLAVVMLVYVSVGNQDEHTRAALRQRDVLDDVPDQVARYLSEQIIGADALDTIYDEKSFLSRRDDVPTLPGTDQEPALWRELTDYGYTPWEMVSGVDPATDLSYTSGTGANTTLVFSPTGGYVRPRSVQPVGPDALDVTPAVIDTSALPISWPASDPWLASNEPTALAYSGLDQFSTEARSSNPANPGYAYTPATIKQDWAHISNIAPDGKFVNLYNLAPIVGGRRVNNFAALPGFGTIGGRPRMSENLSLLVATSPDPRNQQFTCGTTTDFGSAVVRTRPAYWDSRQRGLFRPAKEWRQSSSPDYTPGGRYYILSQYADADGDGMLDSRWQELTESRADPDNPINFLKTDGRYRYFVAARIIDASGKINVNTAGDFTAAPTREHPAGLTPADVDLLRLLQNRDAYERVAFFTAPPAMFSGFTFPTDPRTNTLTAAYDAIPGPTGPGSDEDPQKYAPVDGQQGIWPPDVGDGYSAFRALSAGYAAYTALRLSVATDSFLPQSLPFDPSVELGGVNITLLGALSKFGETRSPAGQIFEPRDPDDHAPPPTGGFALSFGRRFWDFAPTPWDTTPNTSADVVFFPNAAMIGPASSRPLTGPTIRDPHFPNYGTGYPPTAANYPGFAARRAEFYWRIGSASGDVQADFSRLVNNRDVTFARTTATFGMDDLAELLTYAGVNDPEIRSNLESVTAGRDNFPRTNANRPTNARTSRSARFDPLRSNRGFEWEFIRDRDEAGPGAGLADLDARIMLDTSIRTHLTTVSGARALQPVRDVGYATLEQQEVKIDLRDALARSARVTLYPNTPRTGPIVPIPPPATTARNSPITIAGAVNEIYQGYADALLPHSGIDNTRAWYSGDTNFYRRRTLFYGYKGPELAAYAAAHSAVNLVDMADDEPAPQVPARTAAENSPDPATPAIEMQADKPSAFTLLLSEASRGTLNSQALTTYTDWPWWNDDKRLDLNYNPADPSKPRTRLATGATDDDLIAPAANVFGVEAQPFLTAVSVFTVYADMTEDRGPRNAGDPDAAIVNGDDDEDIITDRPRTLRRDVSRRNPDFMYRVLAFQLHNPFGHTIRLGNRASAFRESNGDRAATLPANMADWDVADENFPRADIEEDFYYIEFGGRFFKLSQLVERVKSTETYEQVLTNPNGGLDATMDDITMAPGETIVCYALSQAPRVIYKHRLREVEESIFSLVSNAQDHPKMMQRIFETQFDRNVNLTPTPPTGRVKCYWIPEFDGRVGSPTEGRIGVRVDDGFEPGTPGTRMGANDPPLFGLWSAPDNDASGTNFIGGRFAFGQLLMRHEDNGRAGLAPAAATNVPAQNQAVFLWRAMRSGIQDHDTPARRREYAVANGVTVPSSIWSQDSSSTASTRTLVPNIRANDLLADRLRVPIEPATYGRTNRVVNLDARLYNSDAADFGQIGTDLPGTRASDGAPWDEPEVVPTNATIAVCAAVRRPADPAVAFNAATQIPKGALPAFCLERKDPGDYAIATPRPAWNVFEQTKAPLNVADSAVNWQSISGNDFTGPLPNGGTVIGNAFLLNWLRDRATNDGRISTATEYLPTEYIPTTPTDFSNTRRGTMVRVHAANQSQFDEDFKAQSAHGLDYSTRYAQLILANNGFTAPAAINPDAFNSHSTLRVGDVLLPFAVGPVHVPFTVGVPTNNASRTPIDQAWTTFGESMTTALGYDTFVRPNATLYGKRDAASLLQPINRQPSGRGETVFDRGNLVLDKFVPFIDENGSPTTPIAYQGPELFGGSGNDQRRGNGVPLALNVFDIFSVNSSGIDPRDSRRPQPLSLTRSVPGLININSAPLTVTRSLPMVSPSAGYRDLPSSPVYSSTFFVAINAYSQATPGFSLSFTMPGGRGVANVTGIPRGAPASLVQAALESHPAIGRGNVSVTDGWEDAGGSKVVDYVITFVGDLSYAPVTGFSVTGQDTGRPSSSFVPSTTLRPGVAWWSGGRIIDQTSDIAATMIGYRDKVPTLLRPDAWHRRIPGPAADAATRASSLGSSPWVTVVDFGELIDPATRTPNRVALHRGRFDQTEIFGLNEQPGFPSVGSLLTVRHFGVNPNDATSRDRFRTSYRNNMDFMGHPVDYLLADPDAGGMGRSHDSSAIGIDSVLYGRQAATTTLNPNRRNPNFDDSYRTDNIENEFKEKLAVANALSNVVSTRSDYYICWFVLHGYQESDLDGLGPEDPIVPSIARRFVMVVDRSNVVKRGDKPRILLFKELPYQAPGV